MDCRFDVANAFDRHEARALSASFHMKVIEEALRFIRGELEASSVNGSALSKAELVAACDEALASIADLQSPQ